MKTPLSIFLMREQNINIHDNLAKKKKKRKIAVREYMKIREKK
jgi:hypothetical protein